jgi:hypothetical protein
MERKILQTRSLLTKAAKKPAFADFFVFLT